MSKNANFRYFYINEDVTTKWMILDDELWKNSMARNGLAQSVDRLALQEDVLG